MSNELINQIKALHEKHSAVIGRVHSKAVFRDPAQRKAFIELTKQQDTEVRNLLLKAAADIADAGPVSYRVCHCGRLHQSGLSCNECATWSRMHN